MSTRDAALLRPEPTQASLREAALRHLARYAATQAQLVRVLDRRIDRWLASAGEDADPAAARTAARRVVADLVRAGIVDDAAYAAGRARTLLRTGRSARQVAVHLAQRGVDAAMVREAVPADAERELAAALLLARRRRLGAYAAPGAMQDAAALRRALGAFARAGFSQGVSRLALAMGREEAEARIAALRLG
jgi:regulatory protein